MDSSKAAAEARRQIELQKMNWESNVKKLNDEKERKELEKKRLAEEKKREEIKRRLEETQARNKKILAEE
jgi:formiminotetrahydrofolate cyclodeaminase